MDEDQVRPGALEAVDRAFAAVGGAVVDDHEYALRFAVGLAAHELIDERIERFDPVLGGAAAEDPGVLDVPAGEVAQRAFAPVLVLDQLAIAIGLGGLRRMLARPGLEGGLLIAAHDEVAGMQALALPAP